ncbi:MAG: AI-2E family transporter [Roseiflexaceae bacterium]|nr:AI-2E family transporter [Roseiflexaceae bacterium]
MSSDQLRDTALWLLITATVVFLAERFLFLLAFFANPLLLFGLSWLLSLILQPIVRRLTDLPIPVPVRLRRAARGATEWHIAPALAVPLVYIFVFTLLIVLVIALVPAIGPQIIQLGNAMPTAVATLASWIQASEDQLRRFGFRGDLNTILQPEALAQQVGAIGTALVQQSVGIASSIASLLFSAFLVLILSFYMTIDGHRLSERAIAMMPPRLHEETRQFLELVDRVFGGFLRAQILQSVIYGFATIIIMASLGIGDVALAGVLSAILVAIPLIGSLFALIPPVLIVLVQAPDQTLWLIVLLFIAQQILFNMIMPRLMGQSVGLHPLLVFAAMLIGGTFAGGWGLLFGIPVAGVIASVLQFLYQRASRRAFT